jgi:5-methylcytosine-specific restriction protein A
MMKNKLIWDKKNLILSELEAGTGATFTAVEDRNGLRHGLRLWFADLDEKHGPVAELRPYGLKGHQVTLFFGNFANKIIMQIGQAAQEDVQLARALVASIREGVNIEVQGQNLSDWYVKNGTFKMTATIRDLENPHEEEALIIICREVIVPIMAAMAELIGYDVIGEPTNDEVPAFEGAILRSDALRRERNPRNRLLCIRIHGEKCAVCGLEPKQKYGEAGSIIEVHHLEPVALLMEPRPYDPRIDLVPLCPSCHRAIHTRRPLPFSLEALKALIEACNG